MTKFQKKKCLEAAEQKTSKLLVVVCCCKTVECKEQKKPIPNIYMAIGDEDSLLGVNEDFVAFLRQEHVPVTFEVRPGNHEWDFWDTYIKKAI